MMKSDAGAVPIYRQPAEASRFASIHGIRESVVRNVFARVVIMGGERF
jgi:hypothetical protein